MKFAVTLPLFIHLHPFLMRTSNGQSIPQNSSSENAPVDARQVSGNSKSLSPAQIEFLSMVMFHGVHDLSASLKLVHDIALYHSNYPFEEVEKSALYDMKSLWEGLENMGQGV